MKERKGSENNITFVNKLATKHTQKVEGRMGEGSEEKIGLVDSPLADRVYSKPRLSMADHPKGLSEHKAIKKQRVWL